MSATAPAPVRRLLAFAALVAVAMHSGACIPMLAIAYDQQKQKEQRADRLREQARADEAYEQAIRQIDADAKAAEQQAREVASGDPYEGCLLSADAKRSACQKRAAVMASSRNPTIRAMANAGACEGEFNASVRLCEARNK